MGTAFSSKDKVRPCEIRNFQNCYHPSESEATKNQHKNRQKCTTDTCFLLFLALFLTILLGFVGYCIINGDIFRIINGYDNCGNVCGKGRHWERRNNKRRELCQENIRTDGPYHIVLKDATLKTVDRLCVSNCSSYEGYRKFLNRCVPNKRNTVVNMFFSKTGLKDFFHFFSLIILALVRYLVGLVVWIVLIGAVLASITGTVILWIIWKQTKDSTNGMPSNLIPDIDSRKTETYLAFAILATIVTIVVVFIIIGMRKRIQLVVQLFEESGKAIAVMPVLLFGPILTFLCVFAMVGLWFYFCLWIESSGVLTEKRELVFYYEKNMWMKITRWYNFFALLWMVQFVIGCQHMVIAGAVSTWYFTRDKSKVDSPVIHGFYNLARYHLGSVALGSFLIATVQFARVILKCVEKYLKNREGKCTQYLLKCCQCCLYCFKKILKYLSRNAYIEVAIYGYSFCQAGKQAFKLLSLNVLRVAAINSVGDFVLFLAKVVVIVATVLIGVKMLQYKDGVQHMWVPLITSWFVCLLNSPLLHDCVRGKSKSMTIDTIFLCFCEDCEENDGVSSPYFMSRGLMEFVVNSNKALKMQHDPKAKRCQIGTIVENPEQGSSLES
ncbi:hypothetical protein NQ315_006163 [Exocentrus adspersus]|uniref:Choline transporter-like protein n=1 Tax=Exocentrus adspersus TaxID=1586481 RepID=A0AAV8VZ07_9CUCU|nr:hypothetical protein NQ315_006163 [Exocentrus adspersus]